LITVGIALHQEHLRIAILTKKKSKIFIHKIFTTKDSPESVKQLYTDLSVYHTYFIVSSFLEAHDVLLRRFTLPLTEKRKILATLPFQIESLVLAPHDSIVSVCMDPIAKKSSSVGVFITSQHLFSKHVKSLENKGLHTHFVGCAAASLFRFITWAFPKQKKGIVIHIGSQEMLCLFYQENRLESVKAFSTSPTCFKKNLEKYQLFLSQKGWDTHSPYICIEETPSSIDFKNIVGEIFGGEQIPLEDPDHHLYALTIGAALEAIVEDGNQVNFSQKIFMTNKTKQYFLKKMFCYLGACAVLNLASLIGVQIYLHKKQTALLTHITSILPKELRNTPLKSIQDWQDKLLTWKNKLSTQKFPFPLLPTVPKVSDVLAWISAHPAFVHEGKVKDGIEVSSIHYQMLKYPTVDQKNIPYEAQVEIEFTTPIPRLAREFHESLLKENPMIHTKKPVQWHAQGNKYRAVFTLKPLK
jgi:type IV pilus assembly protein PilM